MSLSPTLEKLSFYNCTVNKLSSPLLNLRVLTLRLSKIGNLNDFNHLNELTVNKTQVSDMTDYSALITAKKLHLEDCKDLSDMSVLQEKEEITLTDCLQFTNLIKCFEKAKKITIVLYTPSVELDVDLSDYSQIKELEITIATFHLGKNDHTMLKNGLATGIIPRTLESLKLYGVRGIMNFTGFEHLKKVSLSYCPEISTLKGLERIPTIDLQGLELTSLEGLCENEMVYIRDCDNIMDFSPLRFVNRVTLRGCMGFTDSSHLDHVAHVIIFSCKQLEDVNGFKNAESVELSDCPLIRSLEALKDVENLKVSRCELLKSTFNL